MIRGPARDTVVGPWEPNGEPIASVEADESQPLFLIVTLLSATERKEGRLAASPASQRQGNRNAELGARRVSPGGNGGRRTE
jgi:hypothetical protein